MPATDKSVTLTLWFDRGVVRHLAWHGSQGVPRCKARRLTQAVVPHDYVQCLVYECVSGLALASDEAIPAECSRSEATLPHN